MPNQPTIRGIYTPHMVPLDAHGQINEPELRRYIDWLIERGVDGLYPNGSTGEFTRFTAEERRRIVQIVCQQARGRVPVLAGAAEANVQETIKACETYHGYGARAVAIVSPIYYRLSDESVYAYFREIAQHSPIDITLYNIPLFTSPITVPVIRRLLDCERIVGIKDSSGDMAFMIRLLAAIKPLRPDFVVMTGWDSTLLPMLVMGCNGGTNAASGVAPELTRLLYDRVCAGDLDTARQLQFCLTELFDLLVYATDFPEAFRMAAALRGINMGVGRQPLSAKQRVAHAGLERTIHYMLSEFGYVEAPVDRPLPPAGALEPGGISPMTAGVLRQLKQRGVL